MSWYPFQFVKIVSEIRIHLILLTQYFRIKFLFLLARSLLLHFIAEFNYRQMEEVDSNIQPLLKKIFQKFDECENCTTVAIQMKNSIKNTTIASYAKTAVENYMVNESSNETSKLKVLTYISAANNLLHPRKRNLHNSNMDFLRRFIFYSMTFSIFYEENFFLEIEKNMFVWDFTVDMFCCFAKHLQARVKSKGNF